MNRNGVILISTLWIIAILSLLAIGIGSRVSMELRLSKYDTDRMKALYLANAGIAKCRDVLSKDTNKYDSLYYCGITPPRSETAGSILERAFKDAGFRDGAFIVMYRNRDGAVVLGMSDEERKININKADRGALVNIFGDEDIADAVMEWRGSTSRAGAGRDMDGYYNSLPNPYKRKNGDFTIVEELLLVRGVTPEVFDAVKEYITVYGEGKININTAPRKVLLALGMTEAAAEALTRYREGPDGMPGTQDDLVFTDINIDNLLKGLQPRDTASIGNLKNSFTVKSDYFKVGSRGLLRDSKIARTVTAVLQRDDKCGGKLIRYLE